MIKRYIAYLPDEERRAIIRQYSIEYPQARDFVETGTLRGHTCEALHDAFDRLYTIEIDRELYQTAVEYLRGYTNVTCLLGDSTVILPELLATLPGPAIFWLDGHYSGGGTGRGPKDTPVAEELLAVLATNVPHIILIDDARMFGEDPAYPTLEWIRETATDQDIEYRFSCVDDIIRLIPVNV